jgi:hypothetical protein
VKQVKQEAGLCEPATYNACHVSANSLHVSTRRQVVRSRHRIDAHKVHLKCRTGSGCLRESEAVLSVTPYDRRELLIHPPGLVIPPWARGALLAPGVSVPFLLQ